MNWTDIFHRVAEWLEGNGRGRLEHGQTNEGKNDTYATTYCVLGNEFTHSKLTLIPHNLVTATIFSFKPLPPVVKMST